MLKAACTTSVHALEKAGAVAAGRRIRIAASRNTGHVFTGRRVRACTSAPGGEQARRERGPDKSAGPGDSDAELHWRSPRLAATFPATTRAPAMAVKVGPLHGSQFQLELSPMKTRSHPPSRPSAWVCGTQGLTGFYPRDGAPGGQ